jgi:hypothetical protein
MAREIAEAPAVFAASVAQPVTLPDLGQHLRAIYTVARGLFGRRRQHPRL